MAKVLVIRTCRADGTSHSGFQWPTSGPVECPDWDATPRCGGGLHGLLWGDGDWSLLNQSHDAIWQVVEVESEAIVKIDEQKVKFPRGVVVYSGGMAEAVTMVLNHQQHFKDMLTEVKANAKKGEPTNISSGDSSTAASSGDSSTAASSGYSSTAASSGNYSKAASSGDSSTAASSGDKTIAMAAGRGCIVQAGKDGCFASAYSDGKRDRILVGYVGEDGIKPDVAYRINVDGKGNAKFVEA